MKRTPWVGDTPPTYVPGFVALCRIYADFFDTDHITADQELDDDGDHISDEDRLEQWGRSRVARYIKKNGTAGTALGIAYRELDGGRIFKPEHVMAKLDEWGVPGHEWLGHNQF